MNYRCEPLPAGALDGHLGARHDRGADGRAGDRHRRVEHLPAGAGQRRRPGPPPADRDRRRDQLRHRGPRRRDHHPRAPGQLANGHHVGVVRRPAPENLDATTLTDNTGADDMVRIEPQRLGAASAPGPTAPDLLDLVPHRVSSNSPRIWESPHVASTPPTSSPTPAAAPSSNPDRTSMTRWCAHRRAGHHRAVHRPAGRHPRARAWGPPHKVGEHPHPPAVSTPTRPPGRHSHPRAGGSGRPDPASTPAGRHRLAVHPAGRPAMCSSGCRRMRIKPAHRLPRPPPAAPAAQRRSGRLPTAAPANHPAGQHRTRCSPRHRRRQAAGRYPLPGGASTTPVTVSALPSSYDAAGSAAARAAGGAVHVMAPPVPPVAAGQEPPSPPLPRLPLGWLRPRRRRSHPRPFAAGVSRC